MISTNIDGSASSGAAQLLDLLSIVSNPAVYEAKVRVLQEAIAQHKAYVEAVAPVAEILELRAQTRADQAAAVQALNKANDAADQLFVDAKAECDGLIEQARKQAASLEADATSTLNAAKEKKAEADKLFAEASTLQASLQAAQKALAAREQDLTVLEQNAAVARAEAEAARAAVIAKHEAFIASLT